MNKKIVETKLNHEKEMNEYNNSIKETSKYLKIKLIIFSIATIIVLVFELLLVSSFCAVYKNSRIEFIISILVSYLYSNIISIVYCLIPSILRKCAIDNKSEILFQIALVTTII